MMADKQETRKNNLSCSLCTKFVKILRHKSDDTDEHAELKCDDCGSANDPVVALCTNCEQYLCNVCNMYHSRKSSTHDVILLCSDVAQSQQKNFYCHKHTQNKLNHFCEFCDEFICGFCTGIHYCGYFPVTVEETVTKCHSELIEVLVSVEEMSTRLSHAEQDIFVMKEKVVKQAEEANELIDKCYVDLLIKLNKQHKQLKKRLQDELLRKEKALRTQLGYVKTVQDQMENVKKQCKILENLSDCKILSKKKREIQKNLKEVGNRYKTLNTLPVETDSIEFVPVNNPNLLLGHLFTSAHPHTSKVVDLPHSISYNTKVDFTIQARNSKGERCIKGGDQISVELKSVTGNTNSGEVKDNKDGTYTVSFVAKEVGNSMLSVIINGHPIEKYPYYIVVGRNYHEITMPDEVINNSSNMGHSWGIAFSKDGIWAVVDNSNNCVYIYDSQDKLVEKFGSKGSNSGQFSNPCGVTFDNVNHLYVVEYGNSRVQKFSINGNYLLQFGNDDDDDDKLKGPVGITACNNKVYVADCSNKCIAVFKTNGKFCTSFGSEHLSGPYDVASASNQLLVADRSHHCIFIFTLDGHYVQKFGTQGSGKGQLNNPRAFAVDINGYVLVADSENYRTSIFDKDGNYIDYFGSQGSNAGQFLYPHGIALSPDGSIYVSDFGNKRIQIFSCY